MKNKKFLRAIATLTVGAVAAAGCVSLTACGHKHTWGDYVPDGASGHYQECTGCDEHSETKPHEMSNGECTVCHWTSSSSSNVSVTGVELNKTTLSLKEGASETLTVTIAPSNATNKTVTWAVTQGDAVTVANGTVTAVKEGTATVTVTTQDGNKTASCVVTVTKDGGGEVTPPVEKDDITINISTDLSDSVADGAELVAGSGIFAVGSLTRNTSTRDIIHPSVTDGKIVSSHRLQLGSDSSGLKIQLEAAATVLIYASGSNATTAGSLQLYQGETAQGSEAPIGQGGVQADVGVASFAVNANTEYTVKRVKGSGTINVIFIAIHYHTITENKGDLVAAVPAQCGVAGMKAHYLSDYGKYYAEDGTTLKQRYELVEAALTHDYSLVPDSVSAATETAVGSAQIKCSHEAAPVSIELPVLGSPDYTTRPAAGEMGTYTYVYQGVTITFEAIGVGQSEVTYTTVYTNDFASGTVGESADVAAVNGGKVYAVDADADGTNTKTATIANGVLSANGVKAYVTLENKIESGVVKISGELKCASANGSWTYFQILDSAGTEFVALRTTKSGSNLTQKVRIDGTETGNSVAVDINATFTFEIIIDLDKKNVTFKVGETVLVDKTPYTKGLDLASVMLNVNSGRTVELSSVTIETQD